MLIEAVLANVDIPRSCVEQAIKGNANKHEEFLIEVLRQIFNEIQTVVTAECIDAQFRILVRNLVSLKVQYSGAKDFINLCQLDTCSSLMGFYVNRSEMNMLWDWVVLSVQDEEVNDEVDFAYNERLIDILESTDEYVSDRRNEVLLEWAHSMFVAASRLGDPIDLIAISWWRTFIDMAVPLLKSQYEYPRHTAWQAVVYCFDWLAASGRIVDASSRALGLYRRYKLGEFEDDVSSQLGLMFSTRVGQSLGLDISSEASCVQARFGKCLHPHENLYLSVSHAVMFPGKIPDEMPRILSGVDLVLASLDAGDPILSGYGRAQVFEQLVGLVRLLLGRGQSGAAIQLITRWKMISEDCEDDVLFCVPTHESGVLYAHGVEAFSAGISKGEWQAGFRAIISQANCSLGARHGIRHDSEFKLKAEGRFGVPNYSEADQFEAALREFYITSLADTQIVRGIEACSSLAMIPYLPHPLQAILLKEYRRTLAYCCSWESPLADRPIRKVMICVDSLMTAAEEVKIIKSLLKNAGVEVDEIESSDFSSFRAGYMSNSYDLIWVIAHGEFDQYVPHHTHIATTNGGVISLVDIEGLKLPVSTQRRLLVLNICSGGTSAALGGFPDFGIASMLTSKSQAVVSHSWPVLLWDPVVFGVIFLKELLERGQYFDAFQAAVLTLCGERQQLFDSLSEIPSTEVLLQKIQNDSVPWNILRWGSPIFLQ